MKVEFLEFDESFLEKSWCWLNDHEIKMLTKAPDFTREEQHNWFQRVKKSKEYLALGVSADSKPIGACGLKNITKTDCEFWGYIGEKTHWGKGIGQVMLKHMQDIAQKMGLISIRLTVVKTNERAINLYKRQGYRVYEESEAMIIMRKMI